METLHLPGPVGKETKLETKEAFFLAMNWARVGENETVVGRRTVMCKDTEECENEVHFSTAVTGP